MYVTVRRGDCAPRVTCNYLATTFLSCGIFEDGSIAVL